MKAVIEITAYAPNGEVSESALHDHLQEMIYSRLTVQDYEKYVDIGWGTTRYLDIQILGRIKEED